jgi:outer membrane beta-barrel protein
MEPTMNALRSLRVLVTSTALALLSVAAAPQVALAQSADDDFDDPLGEEAAPKPTSVRQEREELEADADRDKVKVDIGPAKRKTIKVLQPKRLLKIGRLEVQPTVGGITNDPWVRRYVFGLTAGYHVTEIFSVELQGGFSPNLGDSDWKPVTRQVITGNEVAPQINRLVGFSTLNVSFSPFYGKLATFGRNSIVFDVYATAGGGFAYTQDDLTITETEDDQRSLTLANQFHPALMLGGGVRVQFSKVAGIRFEVRDLSYINAFGKADEVTLEVKNNLMLVGGVSFYLGRRAE